MDLTETSHHRISRTFAQWVEGRLTQSVQVRYGRARSEFEHLCLDQGLDVVDLPAGELDIVAARFALAAKEDNDCELFRQEWLDLLATLQRRAGARLPMMHQILRFWHREEPPRQAEAMPSVVA